MGVVFLYVNPIVVLLDVSTALARLGTAPHVYVSVVARKVLILSPYAKKGGLVFSFPVRGWRLSALFAACLCGAPVLHPPSRHQRSFLHTGSPIEYIETAFFNL